MQKILDFWMPMLLENKVRRLKFLRWIYEIFSNFISSIVTDISYSIIRPYSFTDCPHTYKGTTLAAQIYILTKVPLWRPRYTTWSTSTTTCLNHSLTSINQNLACFNLKWRRHSLEYPGSVVNGFNLNQLGPFQFILGAFHNN